VILLVHELIESLVSDLRSPDSIVQINSIRPHLLRFGLPAGDVNLELRNAGGDVITVSDSMAITDIGTGTYWHGYIQFQLSAQIRPDTLYSIALVSSGYSFSEGGYLGWVNGFDLGKYPGSYAGASGWSAPLDLEIWNRKQVLRGVA
jgi:hypothetical protein